MLIRECRLYTVFIVDCIILIGLYWSYCAILYYNINQRRGVEWRREGQRQRQKGRPRRAGRGSAGRAPRQGAAREAHGTQPGAQQECCGLCVSWKLDWRPRTWYTVVLSINARSTLSTTYHPPTNTTILLVLHSVRSIILLLILYVFPHGYLY